MNRIVYPSCEVYLPTYTPAESDNIFRSVYTHCIASTFLFFLFVDGVTCDISKRDLSIVFLLFSVFFLRLRRSLPAMTFFFMVPYSMGVQKRNEGKKLPTQRG